MSKVIEFEETVKVRHRVIVDDETSEEQIDNFVDNTGHIKDFSDVRNLACKCFSDCSFDEEYYVESDGIEYYADYEEAF